jgi:hypothetical protein
MLLIIFLMKKTFFSGSLTMIIFSICLFSCSDLSQDNQESTEKTLYIGWSVADITPDQPVIIRGSLQARVSEGIMDSLKATVLAMESRVGNTSKKFIMVSCDLIAISDGMLDGSTDNLRDNVRRSLMVLVPEIAFDEIVLYGTHTHAAPFVSPVKNKDKWGVKLDAMEMKDYQDIISSKIANAAAEAWSNRKPGGISFGLGHAVVGHNRLQVNNKGKSYMYGNLNTPEFSHIEGYEDHTVNLLYTWDDKKKLTGVIINLACTSQVTGGYLISADFWHETREEIHRLLGKDVCILAQVSPAGDQSPAIMVGKRAEERMQKKMFPAEENTGLRQRKAIARKISDAVVSVLPYVKDSIDWKPVFEHRMEVVELSRRLLSRNDAEHALIGDWHNPKNLTKEDYKKLYQNMLAEFEKNPHLKEKARWYGPVTNAYIMMKRGYGVKDRYELQSIQPKMKVEIHVLRLGDVVIATNPFELYLDYAIRIKARSPAVQTFLVELAGDGTYVPTYRAIAGGSYGAAPTSTELGPEGGQELVENTLRMMNSLWNN